MTRPTSNRFSYLAPIALVTALSGAVSAQGIYVTQTAAGSNNIHVPEKTQFQVTRQATANAGTLGIVVAYVSTTQTDPKSWGGHAARVLQCLTEAPAAPGEWSVAVNNLIGNSALTGGTTLINCNGSNNQRVPAAVAALAVNEVQLATIGEYAKPLGTNTNKLIWPTSGWPGGTGSSSVGWENMGSGTAGYFNTTSLVRHALAFQYRAVRNLPINPNGPEIDAVIDLLERGMGDLKLHVGLIELQTPSAALPVTSITMSESTEVVLNSAPNVVNGFDFWYRYGEASWGKFLYPAFHTGKAEIELDVEPTGNNYKVYYQSSTLGLNSVSCMCVSIMPPVGAPPSATPVHMAKFDIPSDMITGDIAIFCEDTQQFVMVRIPGAATAAGWFASILMP